jgi:hypothetical protein
MSDERITLDWRPSPLERGGSPTQGYLDGVRLVSIQWHNAGWRVWTNNLPSRYRPKPELRYDSADEARAAAERFVSRWLLRIVEAARESGWLGA